MGNPLYLAPEIIRREQYDSKVDSWSVGVLAYFLLSGLPPFRGRNPQEIFSSVMSSEVQVESPVWSRVSDLGKDFVLQALTKGKDERPTVDDLLAHPWAMGQFDPVEAEEEVQKLFIANLANFQSAMTFFNRLHEFMENILSASDDLRKLNELY
mmetsp:Transcript_34398/g.25473  ORF Transcript_34398/g.25473 Transcript_34398/m.25473 type:complete len:154 (+) Transcript_34398:731-1192(+)